MTEMKNTRKMTLLSAMEEVVNNAKIYGLEQELYKSSASCVSYLKDTLELSEEEVVLLSLFLEMSSSRIFMSSIADMLETSTIKLIGMMNVADKLVKKGYVKHNNVENWYAIPKDVIDCIRENRKIVPKPISGLEFDQFFNMLDETLSQDGVSFFTREEDVNLLVSNNMHLDYCKAVKAYKLNGIEEILLHIFSSFLINMDDDYIGPFDWVELIEPKSNALRILRNLKSGTSDLVKKGILESKLDNGIRDPNFYHLTDNAKETLFPDLDLVDNSAKYDKSLVSYTSFSAKQMYYTPKVQAQVERLGELLKPEQFKYVTDRLSENGMRKGFAVLFYGTPGTGKSETVYQLARMTGRDVMVVDVTQIKSCWAGESEKNIKNLFDKYRTIVRNSEIAPILLFNEADAVLGIRQEGAQKAIEKMENSIQNIILQEMESLEGIMIATTNLTSNLDKAFERRFIYKIEFERPTIEAKKQIWKYMIPTLSDEFAYSLAKDYELSGGQIENVSRKRTVEMILSGVDPSEEMIREYCRNETLNTNQSPRNRIGF